MISRSNEFKKMIMEISRYLVELLGYCSEGSNRLLVYEIVSNNSLQFHLHGKGKFKNNIRWVIRKKIAIGQPKLIHGNMKLNNILLEENVEPKISDYYYHRFPSVYNANRNLGYVAAEYMNDGEITTKFDVFSFGIILLQLITGKPAVENKDCISNNLSIWVRIQISQFTAHKKIIITKFDIRVKSKPCL